MMGIQRRIGSNWLPFILFIISLIIFLPTVGKDRVVTDSQAAAASAWRIATTGSPWMDGVKVSDLEGSPFPEMWLVETTHGHTVHNRTPGVILAGVPFYWMLNKESTAANFEIWVGGISASFFTAVAGLLIYFGMRPIVGERSAFVAACALLFATPVWSVSADALWTQNLTILAIAGAIYSVVHRRWWATGVFFAIGIFARAHFAVVAAVVGLYLGWRRRDWRITIHIGLSSAWGIVLLAIWNRMVYGSWSLRGGYGEYVTANILGDSSLFYEFANVAGFLLAPGRGILIWTPVILLLLPAMLAFWRDLPDWVRGFVFAGIAYSAVQLRINYFLGGAGFFGYRLALELLVCIAPALIYAYKTTATPTRYVIGGIVGLQFAAISIGASTDGYNLTDGNVWTTNAYVVALMDRPWLYGLVTGTCAVAGMLVTRVGIRRTQDRQPIEV